MEHRAVIIVNPVMASLGIGVIELVVLTYSIIFSVALLVWGLYRVLMIYIIQHQNQTNENVSNELIDMREMREQSIIDRNEGINNQFDVQELVND